MNLSAIINARVELLVPAEELSPRGVAALDLVKGIVDRYGFGKYPRTLDEMGNSIEFTAGKLGDIAINKLIINFGGVIIDTRSSTDDSEVVLNDLLTWGSQALKMTYKSSPTEKRGFGSQLVFHSDAKLDLLHEVLRRIADKTAASVNKQLHTKLSFETIGLTIGYDTLATRLEISQFRIERRNGVPFEDNRYYSQAPLRTQEHIELLELYESALKAIRRR